MQNSKIGLATGVFLALALPTSAMAKTASVRVEGVNKTLLEQTSTTTKGTAFSKDGNSSHLCAANSAGDALNVATAGNWAGNWSASFGDYLISTIIGETPVYTSASPYYWSFIVNGAPASTGACQTAVADGDELLFAVVDGNANTGVLSLSSPSTTNKPGQDFSVTVKRTATSYPPPSYNPVSSTAPVSGAKVSTDDPAAPTFTTDSNGAATVKSSRLGPLTLKATTATAGDIRSERETTCITDGADGACGTTKPGTTTTVPPTTTTTAPAPDRGAPEKRTVNITQSQMFAAGKGPRTLSGSASDAASSVTRITARLTRRSGKKCWRYSGRREQFIFSKKCSIVNGIWFKVSTTGDWSYVLPKKLEKGRYVLDVRATDRNGNYNKSFVPGNGRVTFRVK